MADGDRQLAFTTGPVPSSVQVSGPDKLTPKSVNASFNGTGAAGAFLPCLIITGRTGLEVARIPAPQVAAGASAEVSWFPRVGGKATFPPPNTSTLIELDYVQFTNNVAVTSNDKHHPTLVVSGNTITVDGNTEIEVQVYMPIIDTGTSGTLASVRVALWDGANPIGICCFVGANFTNTEVGASAYGSLRYTPAAGAHRYIAYAYRTGGGACTILAGSVAFQPDTVLPGFIRVLELIQGS